jgi:hypothetical protein
MTRTEQRAEPSSSTAEAAPSTRWKDLALCGLVMLLACMVLAKDITVGGFRFGDAAAHAMDGVLIHDWMAAGPEAWGSPMAFAAEQYGHYPTLGIGRHYPPGYAMFEAGFFALSGISIFSARCCVVFFGMLAAAGAYTFARFWSNRPTAILAAVILTTMPATTTWGRQNMLEMPTMAVLVWAAVAFAAYLRKPTPGRLGVVIAACVAAVFFKQPAVFLIGVVAIVLLFAAARRSCPWSHAIAAVFTAMVAAWVTVLSLDANGQQLLSGYKSYTDRLGWTALSYYARQLPNQISLAYCLAAGAGLILARRRMGRAWSFLVLWLVAAYAIVTIADYKNPRYLYFALFPPAVWAATAAGEIISRMGTGARQAWLAGGVITACVGFGLAAPVEHRPDYGPLVQAHRDAIEGNVVLFSGLRDGDFVFAVRQHVPRWRTVVIRGSKLLYTCNGFPGIDFQSRVSSVDEVSDLLSRFAFRCLFVERENKLDLAEDSHLREALAREVDFRRRAVHHLQAESDPGRWDVTIDVYEPDQVQARAVDHFDIFIPRARRTVSVDLRGLHQRED